MKLTPVRPTIPVLALVACTLLLASPTAASIMDTASPGSSNDSRRYETNAPPQLSVSLVRGSLGAAPQATDQELRDYRWVARSRGSDLAHVEREYREINQFTAIVNKFEERYPETFIGAGMSEADEPGHFWVAFTRIPDESVRDELSAGLSEDSAVWEGAPASIRELSNIEGAIFTYLADRQDRYANVAASVGARGDSITVRYRTVSGDIGNSQDLQNALQAGADASQTGRLPVPVNMIQDPDLPAVDAQSQEVVGGHNVPACTLGFTAVRNGVKGIVTAEHCASGYYDTFFGNVITWVADASPLAGGGNIDLQFERTMTEYGNTTSKRFRVNGTLPSNEATVTGVGNPVIGATLCHWGSASGYSCADVVAMNLCRTDEVHNLQACALSRVNGNVSVGGDSGGPWFASSNARGIHWGTGDNSYFTQIGAVSNNLSATVLQQ